MECSEAILSEVFKPSTQISTPVVLLISEGEHPELDSVLNGALTDPAMLQESLASVRTAAVVLRAGSRALLPAVDNVLTESNAKKGFNCQVQGYFLGYLFRVAAEHAQSRLGESLQNGKCANQLFHILNTVRPSEGILPVAVSALNSPDFAIAGQAACYFSLIMDPRERKTYYGGGWMRYGTFGTTKVRNCEPTRLKPVCNGKLPCWNRVWPPPLLTQRIGI